MLIIPSKRPEGLKRFLDAYKATGATSKCITITELTYQKAIAQAYHLYPDEPFYALLADDCIPITEGWDLIMAEAAKLNGLAWANDGICKDTLPTHPFFSGDLIRKWGGFAPEGLNKQAMNLFWKDFGGKYIPDVIIEHKHWVNKAAEYDTVYALADSVSEGYKQFREWKVNNERVA